MTERITNEDIQWWESHLDVQYKNNSRAGVIQFVSQLVKLAKAVRELQEATKH